MRSEDTRRAPRRCRESRTQPIASDAEDRGSWNMSRSIEAGGNHKYVAQVQPRMAHDQQVSGWVFPAMKTGRKELSMRTLAVSQVKLVADRVRAQPS